VPLAQGEDFPWCGLAIDTKTLDVKAGTATHLETGEGGTSRGSFVQRADTSLAADVSDKLTVQRHKKPGQSFINTMLR
jgi:hypothetical protein